MPTESSDNEDGTFILNILIHAIQYVWSKNTKCMKSSYVIQCIRGHLHTENREKAIGKDRIINIEQLVTHVLQTEYRKKIFNEQYKRTINTASYAL